MEPDAKSVNLQDTARLLPFSYRVRTLGYDFHAPPVKLFNSSFGEHIEICLRLRSYDDGNRMLEQTLNGNEYCNKYPHALVKCPGLPYSYRNFAERDVVYFIYDGSRSGELEKLGVFDPPHCWDIELSPEMEFFIRQLLKWMNISQEGGIADRIDAACFHLLNELLIQRKHLIRRVEPETAIMEKIDSYFQFHALEEIDIDALSANYGLSRGTFFRYWSRYSEVSPARYLLDLRLREACRRLSSSRDKIHVIADSLNFRNAAYFCAVFRKKYGMTPLEYRERHQPEIT